MSNAPPARLSGRRGPTPPRSPAGWPDPPEDIESDKLGAILAAIVPIPGSMLKVTPTGGWGDPKESTPEKGEAYLKVITESVLRFVRDVEKVYVKSYG